MSRPRRTRRDRNHAQVVDCLKRMGAHVIDCADHGGVDLDLVVCWRGRCVPVEIKAPGCGEDLTTGEKEGIARLAAVGVGAIVAVSVEDVVEAFEGGE